MRAARHPRRGGTMAGQGDGASPASFAAAGWESSAEEDEAPTRAPSFSPGGVPLVYSPAQGPPRGIPPSPPPPRAPREGTPPWPRSPVTGGDSSPWDVLRINMDAKMAELRAEKAEAAQQALEEMAKLKERIAQAESARDALEVKLEAARDKIGVLAQTHAGKIEMMEMAKKATDHELDVVTREATALRAKVAVLNRDHEKLELVRAENERLKEQIAQQPGTTAANESYIDAVMRVAELEEALAEARHDSEDMSSRPPTSAGGRADSPGMRAQLSSLVQEAEAAAAQALELDARLKTSEGATSSLRHQLRASQEKEEALRAEVEALRRAAADQSSQAVPKTPGPVRDAYRAENEALLAENAAVKAEIEAVRSENELLRRANGSGSTPGGEEGTSEGKGKQVNGMELLEQELRASAQAIEAARAENALLRQAVQEAEARVPSPAAALDPQKLESGGSVQVMEQQLIASSKVIEALMTENIDMMATLNKQSNQLALLKARLDEAQPDAPRPRSLGHAPAPSSSSGAADVLGGDFVDDYGRHPARRGVVSLADEGSDDEEEGLPSPAVFRGQTRAGVGKVPAAEVAISTPPRGQGDGDLDEDEGEFPALSKPRRRGPLTFLYGYIAGDDRSEKARMEV